MNKIAVVYQYPQFAKHTEMIRETFPDITITKFRSGKNKSLVIAAKEAELQNYTAIVCGGFTYDAIIDSVDIPVINIEPSLSDLFESWYLLKQKNIQIKKAAVFLFHRNPMLRGNLEQYLSEFFDSKITFVKYKSISEYDDLILSLQKQTDIIIGGAHSVEKCSHLNINNEYLGIGVNTFRMGIEEAIRVSTARVSELLKKNQIHAVLDASYEGIIYSNESGHVELVNSLAREILGIAMHQSIEGTHFNDLIPGSKLESVSKNGNPELEDILPLPAGNKIMINMVPVKTSGVVRGVVTTFKDATQLIEMGKKIRADLYKSGTIAKYKRSDIVGDSDGIKKCKDLIEQFGEYDGNILINGETGTGKELFAQSIHNESSRKNEPFYAINCAALPDNLLESELFGYSEGSFTGAKKGGKPGIFELAHKGTVYLDEIGEMTIPCQSSLLRVLQENEVRRIGDDKIIPIDVRVIAATHKNLFNECINNRFREDLYYRIDVMSLDIPPLRKRKQDIFVLVNHFVKFYSEKYSQNIDFKFTDEAKCFIENYPWRGNVREVQNFAQRLFVYGFSQDIITLQGVEALLHIDSNEEYVKELKIDKMADRIYGITLASINEAIEMFGGNKTKAAEYLGVSRTFIWRKLNENKKE